MHFGRISTAFAVVRQSDSRFSRG